MKEMIKRSLKGSILAVLLVITMAFMGCSSSDILVDTDEVSEGVDHGQLSDDKDKTEENDSSSDDIPEDAGSETPISVTQKVTDISAVPGYSGTPYLAINGNIPYFSDEELTETAFEYYSDLDSLGRCGLTFACVGKEIMPMEKRGEIGQVKPTGWNTVKYDIVDGNYLYNRCHLIGYQLTGENANTKNLITGTRYMNVDGMLPFENMVADYIKETGNHVMYRVIPVFEGNNLLAAGVQMEAYSVEDSGDGVCYNVFVYLSLIHI